MENTDTDVNVDSSSATDTSVTTVDTTSNVSEDVKDTGSVEDKTVPYQRFHEVNEAKREAEEAAEQARQELEELRNSSITSSQDDEEEIDPEVESLVARIMEKRGFVSKDELTARDLKMQFDSDVIDLTNQYKDSGVPFNQNEVLAFAKKENIPVTNKATLQAVYKVMNEEKILEQTRNRAIAEFKENGSKTSAEKPGPGGAKAPEQEEVHGVKSRIAQARNKLNI
jgi:hypothetical protein